MKKRNLHTSPDMFDQSATNVYHPNSARRIGQIVSGNEGFTVCNVQNEEMDLFSSTSEAIQSLSDIPSRKRAKKVITSWDERMKAYRETFNKYKT